MIIDAHCHVIGTCVEEWKNCSNFADLGKIFASGSAKENPDALLEAMDRHGIDKACVQGAFGRTIEEQAKFIQAYPDRFIGFCNFSSGKGALGGKEAAREIGQALKMPEFRGIGELSLHQFQRDTLPATLAEFRPIMDVAAEAKVPVLFHTGVNPYRSIDLSNPMYLDELAQEYPNVPIIVGHMGIQGYYFFGVFAEMALLTAARHPNVYLETSSAPVEVLERAYLDPAIGTEKLLFGTDFPAPYAYYERKGRMYPSYGKRPPEEYPPHHKFCLRVIEQSVENSDDRQLVLGENIVRLLRLDNE